MSFFDHPVWPLLIFGFFLCPRLLLLALWVPVRSRLGEVIEHPFLAVVGTVFAPRLTLAILCAGFYWQSNSGLCVAAFILSFLGESIEKTVFKKKVSRVRISRHN